MGVNLRKQGGQVLQETIEARKNLPFAQQAYLGSKLPGATGNVFSDALRMELGTAVADAMQYNIKDGQLTFNVKGKSGEALQKAMRGDTITSDLIVVVRKELARLVGEGKSTAEAWKLSHEWLKTMMPNLSKEAFRAMIAEGEVGKVAEMAQKVRQQTDPTKQLGALVSYAEHQFDVQSAINYTALGILGAILHLPAAIKAYTTFGTGRGEAIERFEKSFTAGRGPLGYLQKGLVHGKDALGATDLNSLSGYNLYTYTDRERKKEVKKSNEEIKKDAGSGGGGAQDPNDSIFDLFGSNNKLPKLIDNTLKVTSNVGGQQNPNTVGGQLPYNNINVYLQLNGKSIDDAVTQKVIDVSNIG